MSQATDTIRRVLTGQQSGKRITNPGSDDIHDNILATIRHTALELTLVSCKGPDWAHESLCSYRELWMQAQVQEHSCLKTVKGLQSAHTIPLANAYDPI